MSETMRAAVWSGSDGVEVTRVPIPTPPAGWALLRVERVGICGTDLAILHGQHPRAAAPLIMGHELVGTVEIAAGDGPHVGARVAVEPLISCGACRACRSGSTHVCRDLKLYGIDEPGGLAEYVAVPAKLLHEIPVGVAPDLAALVEPLAVAVHAVHRASIFGGEVVAVLGGGPIGLLTALVARRQGAAAVVISEPNPWRRKVATDLGFVVVPDGERPSDVLADLTGGEGADVTFDAAAHPAVALEATACTRVLGTVVVVGVYKQPAAIDLRTVGFKEQTLVGVRVYTSDDVREAVAMVTDGSLELDRLPVSVFPLDRAAEAFKVAETGEGCVKVLVSVAS